MFIELAVLCPEGHQQVISFYFPEVWMNSTKTYTCLCPECGRYFKAYVRVAEHHEVRADQDAPSEWEPSGVAVQGFH